MTRTRVPGIKSAKMLWAPQIINSSWGHIWTTISEHSTVNLPQLLSDVESELSRRLWVLQYMLTILSTSNADCWQTAIVSAQHSPHFDHFHSHQSQWWAESRPDNHLPSFGEPLQYLRTSQVLKKSTHVTVNQAIIASCSRADGWASEYAEYISYTHAKDPSQHTTRTIHLLLQEQCLKRRATASS